MARNGIFIQDSLKDQKSQSKKYQKSYRKKMKINYVIIIKSRSYFQLTYKRELMRHAR